jgi:DNA-binding MarR family transcriptional regulator
MSKKEKYPDCVQIADLIALLFTNCQEKESRFIAEHEVSVVEFRCMRILYEFEQLTVNQLAEKMSLTSSRITRIIDGLVSKKIVNRELSQTDRRFYDLSLTGKGIKLVKKLNEAYAKIHKEILSIIPDEYYDSMLEGITQLNNAVERWLNK